MTERVETGRELVASLRRELAEARQQIQALATGQIDVAALASPEEPVLLRDAQEALRRREERLRALVEHCAEGVTLVHADGTIIYASPGAGRILGLTPANIEGQAYWRFIHPEDAALAASAVGQSIENPGTRVEVVVRASNGAGGWRVCGCVLVSRLDEPAVAAVVCNFTDVTEHHQARAALQASESRYRDMVHRSPIAFCSSTPAGQFLDANRACLDLLGFGSLADLQLQNPATLYADPADRPRVLEAMQHDSAAEVRLRRRDGELRWVRVFGRAVGDGAANVAYYEAFLADVTSRKIAEETAQRLTAIVESSDDAIFSKDLEGTVLTWNAAAERMFGYSSTEMIGQNVRRLEAEEGAGEIDELLQRIGAGMGIQRHETIRVRRDGTPIHLSLTLSPMRDDAGGVVAASVIARDVTEQRRTTGALAESQAFLHKAQEVAHIGSWISDPDSIGKLVWSPEVCRIFGIAESEFDGTVDAFFARVHPDDLDTVKAATEAAFAGATPYSIDHRIVWSDGTVRWVHEQADILKDADGRPASDGGHRAGHHSTAGARGAVPSGPEDGGGRTTGRRHSPRFQQPPGGHPRIHRTRDGAAG